eukprot:746521-Hanusia_phi.AAC.2
MEVQGGCRALLPRAYKQFVSDLLECETVSCKSVLEAYSRQVRLRKVAGSDPAAGDFSAATRRYKKQPRGGGGERGRRMLTSAPVGSPGNTASPPCIKLLPAARQERIRRALSSSGMDGGGSWTGRTRRSSRPR